MAEPSDRLVVIQGAVGTRVLKRLPPDHPGYSDDELALVESRLVPVGGIRPKVRIVERSRYVPPPEEAA